MNANHPQLLSESISKGFVDLPNEMIQSACHFLPIEALSKLSRVNTRLSTVLHHRFAWCHAPLSLIESPIDIPSTSIVTRYAPMTVVWRSTELNVEQIQDEVDHFHVFARCEHLHLYQNDSGTVLPLSRVLALPNIQLALRELTIHVRWLDPECARFLPMLTALQQLIINKEWSNDEDQGVTDQELEDDDHPNAASSSVGNPALTDISSSSSRNTLEFFRAVSRIPNLRVLKIFNGNSSPTSGAHLYPLGNCPSLTNLFLSGNEGVLGNQQEFIRFLSGDTFRRTLEYLTLYRFTLDFGWDQYSDQSYRIDPLGPTVAALESLHTLDLARCDGLNWILSQCVRRMRSLRHLILRSRFDARHLETALVELDDAHPLESVKVYFTAVVQFGHVQTCVDAVNNTLKEANSKDCYTIEGSELPAAGVFPHVLIKRLNDRTVVSNETMPHS